MAMIAHPPAHLPARHDRTWDEAIVPSLRKRLQHESRALAKRISAASIPSGTDDEHSAAPFRPPYDTRVVTDPEATPRAGRVTPPSQRPSAIPRPSFQQENGRTPSKSSGRAAGKVPPGRRPRTQSTPYPFDRSESASPSTSTHETAQTQNGIPTPGSSRAGSPMVIGSGSARPSRIPTAAPRARSGSTSSHSNSQHKANGNGSRIKDRGDVPQVPSPPSTQQPQIRDEPAPFSSDSALRTSAESFGERPFAQWYRGEATRNGGVGEYRVGRKEMLDIANFGHQRPSVPISASMRRRRADSLDGKRESWFMDEREREAVVRGMGRVMDEDPLTDLDGDTDMDGMSSSGHHRISLPPDPPPVPSLHAATAQTQTSPPLPPSLPQTQSAIPQPQYQRRQTKPPSPPPSQPAAVRSPRTSSAGSSRPQNVKSPGSTPAKAQPSARNPPTPQKQKQRPTARSPAPKARSRRENGSTASENRDSTLADAIPTMPAPPPQGSNWDEIVLPGVARRMGIEGYGVKSDGGIIDVPGYMKPVEVESPVFEPAPGTFGYNYQPKEQQFQMSEFGERPAPVPEVDTPQATPAKPATRKRSVPRMDRPPSPAPFSAYTPDVGAEPQSLQPPKRSKRDTVPEIKVSPPSVKDGQPKKEELDEGAGCCKCVIM